MFNLKVCGIVAAAAFLLSFLLGLASRTLMPLLLVRPLVFAAVFFGISIFINFLISRFLPELIETHASGSDSDLLPGTRINIVEGDSDESPLDFPSGESSSATGLAFAGAQPDDEGHEMGDISELAGSRPEAGGIFEGMDQNIDNGYNQQAEVAGSPEGAVKTSFGGGTFDGSDEILPDLDSMAGAFSSGFSSEEPDTTNYSVSTPAKKSSSGGKEGAEWAGDFQAKDMAKGIQTILKKDKAG